MVEFNARMGDPETQPIMMRLKTDFLTLVEHAIDGKLDQIEAEWDRRAALGVVMAAAGLSRQRLGKATQITGLPKATDDARVFHAGTIRERRFDSRHQRWTRVVCDCAGRHRQRSRSDRAYQFLEPIRFEGMQYPQATSGIGRLGGR